MLSKENFFKSKNLSFLIKEFNNQRYLFIIKENKLVLILYINKCIKILKKKYIYIKNKQEYKNFKTIIKKKFSESDLGFYVDLLIKGIGYSVYLYGKFLYFNLGFSHYIVIKIPKLVNVLKFKRRLVFYSYDKNSLNNFISKLYSFRGLDIYKGQGIVNKNITIKLKPVIKKREEKK